MAKSKNPSYLTVDVYRKSFRPMELNQIRRTLAKQANQRLVRLERAKSTVTGESFASYGAAQVYSGEYLKKRGRRRFSEVLQPKGYNVNDLRREITVLQAFLNAKTSTVKGQREVERARIETFEKGKWGRSGKNRHIKFASNKEFYDFLNSETFNGLIRSGFTSEQIVDLYDQARSRQKGDADATVDAMQNALDQFRAGTAKTSYKNLRDLLGVDPLIGSDNK